MTLQTTKMLFGFLLLVVLAVLAAIIAIGHVEQNTSFGLQYVLGSLATLAGGFSTWAFTKSEEKSETPEPKQNP